MIRDYDRKDLKAILEINEICHLLPEPSLQLLELLHLNKTWVYELDGKVVGFLMEQSFTGEPYIYNVSVLPEYQGRGIASELIKEFESYFADRGNPFLHVNTKNDAKYLYYKLGYRVKDVHINFYGQGQHAFVMRKQR